MTKLVDFFNANFKKKDGTKFTFWNIYDYVKRGKAPEYIGGNLLIRPCKLKNCEDITLYQIVCYKGKKYE